MKLSPVDEVNLAKWMLQESPPSAGSPFRNEQATVQHEAICRVCEEVAEAATEVSKGSLRRTQCCAPVSQDVEMRGWEVVYDTTALISPLLLRSVSPLFLFLPHLTLFLWVITLLTLSCSSSPLLFYPLCLHFLIFSIKLFVPYVFSFMSFTCFHLSIVFFGRGSCKHSCLCLHIYIQHHLSGFMAWQSPLQPEWMTVLLPLMSTVSLLLAQALAYFIGWNAIW